MKRTSISIPAVILTLAVAAILLPRLGSQAQAQPGCLAFQAIGQATLPSSAPLAPDDAWGGPIYASLDGEILLGVFSGNDGGVTWRGAIGAGRAGAYKVCFGFPCSDSFTYEVANAVFPNQPGKIGFGVYLGNTAKIARGTGRFESASGNLNVTGPYVAWTPDGGTTWLGRFNAQVSGRICGVH